MQDLAGQQLGNYQLIQLLGRGGYAEVYLGKHVRLDSQAAIKVLHTRLVSSEEIDRFQDEGRIIASLVHPHIIRVLDFDVQQNIPFMVMDYAPNGTLRRRHPKGEQLALPVILPYVKQIADALQYAHDQQYVHRDIKPANMLVGRNDEVLLSDFGTALVAQVTGYQNTVQGEVVAQATGYQNTAQEEVVGTVSYMAPEQFQGITRPASDQYALAVVVYEWLSGSPPFHGTSTEIAIQHSMKPPPTLLEKVPGLSPQVEQVIMRALAKDYHQRYPTVQEFALALEQASLSGSSFYAESTEAVPVMAPGALSDASVRDEAYHPSPEIHPAMHTNYPPMKPAPLAMDTVTSEAAHASAPAALYPPYPGTATPPDWQQPLYQEQPRARRSRFGLAILLVLLVLLLVVGGLAWYVIPRLASSSSTPTSQPGPVYPNVVGTYNGTLINATANITTSMSLSIHQNNANITGDFKVGAPLVGSNPFTGHVNPSKHIWFTVQSYQGNAPLYFDGSIQSDSSLAGSYCSLASNGKCNPQAGASGTWKVARNLSTAASNCTQCQGQEQDQVTRTAPPQCGKKSCKKHSN